MNYTQFLLLGFLLLWIIHTAVCVVWGVSNDEP